MPPWTSSGGSCSLLASVVRLAALRANSDVGSGYRRSDYMDGQESVGVGRALALGVFSAAAFAYQCRWSHRRAELIVAGNS